MNSFRLAFLFAALVAMPSRLFAATINFDTLGDSVPITTQFAGLVFSHATALTAGVSLDDTEFPPRSGANVAFDDGGPMRIDFTQPISAFGAYFTYGQSVILRAFDLSNVLLGSTTSLFPSNFVSSGHSPNELLQIAVANISHVTITGDPSGDSFVLDDLTYTPNQTSPVPEPGSLSLIVLGGAALLRKRRSENEVGVPVVG
jgi:hypothetical protein